MLFTDFELVDGLAAIDIVLEDTIGRQLPRVLSEFGIGLLKVTGEFTQSNGDQMIVAALLVIIAIVCDFVLKPPESRSNGVGRAWWVGQVTTLLPDTLLSVIIISVGN